MMVGPDMDINDAMALSAALLDKIAADPDIILGFLCERLGTKTVMEALHRVGDVKAVQHQAGVKADAVVTAYVPLS